MTVDVMMPALSPTMEKGTLARWLVRVGGGFKAGDAIAEIETDKATMELEAATDGVLCEILVPEGTDDVAVGTLIARLSDAVAGSPPGVPGGTSGYGEAKPGEAAPRRGEMDEEAQYPLSPSARRAARSTNVDLRSVSGTGRDGRLTKEDILRAGDRHVPATGHTERAAAEYDITPLAQRVAKALNLDPKGLVERIGGRVALADVLPPAPISQVAISQSAEPVAREAVDAERDGGAPYETIKLSGMRRTIARRLSEAKRDIPHIYLSVEVRTDALLALRSRLNQALSGRGVKLSINDLLIKAQALALLEAPACNVEFSSDGLKRFSRADISVAVAIPDGLVTPIILDAGARSLASISRSMRDLAERARAGTLQPGEYTGGTATLSNLGMFGIKQFEAIINPPQAMILAVGAGDRRLDLVDGQVVEREVLILTGSFDHRAVDGTDAAGFMNALRTLIENPLSLLD